MGFKKASTFSTHPWILNTSEGYYCSICKASGFVTGVWVNLPVSKQNSVKLYEKAKKHASSGNHLMAVQMQRAAQGNTDIMDKLNQAINKCSSEKESSIRDMFRLAYFLFASELPHTTNWRTLVSTTAAVERSGRLDAFFKKSSSRSHHLSTTTITEILHCFRESHDGVTKAELRNVTEFAVMADEGTEINGHEMLSVCIRYMRGTAIIERFLGAIEVVSTTAEVVYSKLIDVLNDHALNPSNPVAASFDGASNFSGPHRGVQAMLRQNSPNMIYIHCRSHVLQLCMVKACNNEPGIKRVVSLLNKLFSLFRGSAKRLNVLHSIEEEIDKCSHKLVQPADTRWLSHEASVSVVCKHYGSICMALEHIYQDAGNMSSDAGGLLLVMRKDSSIFVMAMLSLVLKPLARLSMSLQSASDDILHAVENANIVKEEIRQLVASDDMPEVTVLADAIAANAKENNIFIEQDTTLPRKAVVIACRKYVHSIVSSIEQRFSDDVGRVAVIINILKRKPELAEFTDISRIFGISQDDIQYEWRMLRRLNDDLSSRASLVELATASDRAVLFPCFSLLARRILLMPIGTASVERSFSAMNRILNSDRCRLTPDHVDTLMRISIEGPTIPDIRDGTADEVQTIETFFDKAFEAWQRRPHRD